MSFLLRNLRCVFLYLLAKLRVSCLLFAQLLILVMRLITFPLNVFSFAYNLVVNSIFLVSSLVCFNPLSLRNMYDINTFPFFRIYSLFIRVFSLYSLTRRLIWKIFSFLKILSLRSVFAINFLDFVLLLTLENLLVPLLFFYFLNLIMLMFSDCFLNSFQLNLQWRLCVTLKSIVSKF